MGSKTETAAKAAFGCIGCLGAAAFMLAIAFAVVAVLAGVFFGKGAARDSSSADAPEEDTLPTVVWERGGEAGSPAVMRLRLEGEIAFSDGSADIFGDAEPSAAEALLERIRDATRDDEVRGLLLELDTPGGEVTAADVIADALASFRVSATNRFVVVHMGSMCCSGGYYIAAAADWIVAHPTTVTGSIGVIMSTYNAAGLAEKLGVKSVTVATGANKNMLDPLSPVDESHLEVLRRVVDADYERFIGVIAAGREMDKEKVRALADGRVFSAKDALELGLVDAIGYRDDVWDVLDDLAGEPVRICRYEERRRLGRIIADALGSASPLGAAAKRLGARPRARLEYRLP